MKRPRHVLLTVGKELRETLRDRRTLAVMVLFPLVLYPLLALVGTQVVAAHQRGQEARASVVAVLGTDPFATDVRARLRGRPKLFDLRERGAASDVDAGHLDALVEVTPTADGKRGAAAIVFDATRDESRQAEDRLDDELAQVLPDGCTPRFVLTKRNLAPGSQIGGYVLSKALPLMILLMVLLGAFYPAIDVTAGERERGTLETILTSPIARIDLLLGKILAVTVLASLSGVVNLGSMTLTLVQVVNLADPTTNLPVPWSRAAATGLVIVPTAFLLASLFVAVGSLARGFKDAQNLLVPVYFLFFAPAMLGSLGDFPLRGLAAVVPGMNVSLLARDIALGKATLGATALVLGSTLLAGVLALAAAARLYASERFLGGGDEDSRSRRGGPRPREAAGVGDALVLFALGFVLLFAVFLPLQRQDMIRGLLVSQWGGMVGLVLAYLVARARDVRASLGLTPPAPLAVVGAALMGATGWTVAALLSQWIAPPSPGELEALRNVLFPPHHRPLVVTLALFALTPAICEEVFFRGAVLRGLRSGLRPWTAIVTCAVMFGFFHVDVSRLLPTTLLGLMLSWIALRTRSLWPSVLAHFLNNAFVVVLAAFGFDRALETMGKAAQTGLFAGALAVLAVGGFLLTRAAGPSGRL
jgi:sodium transport system permease protein